MPQVERARLQLLGGESRVGASGKSSPSIVRRSRLVPQVERARLQLLGEAGLVPQVERVRLQL